MNAFARSLVLLAVAGHVLLAGADAFAAARGIVLAQASTGIGGTPGGPGTTGAGTTGTGTTSSPGSPGSTGAATGGYTSPAAPAAAPAPAPGAVGVSGAGISLPFAVAPAACGDLELPDPNNAADALAGLEEISKRTQDYIKFCGCKTQACIADALDKYADAIEKVTKPAPEEQKVQPKAERLLPRAIRELPKIIHAAAARVRAAPTVKAAVRVLNVTVAAVQRTVAKAIALLRANDPDAKSVATRGGDVVAETVKVAADALARADSL